MAWRQGITPPDARFEGTSPVDPARWPGGLTWDRQKLDFARYVTARFRAEPEKFLFVPNLAGLTTGWWWPHYDMIDGAMLEGFALDATPPDWVLSMSRALELSRADKLVIVQAYPKTAEDRLFLVGSYLLLKGRHTYVNASGAGIVYFPEYLLDFGPAAPLPSDVDAYAWSGVYRRDFRNGMVLVNPSMRAVTVRLPQALSLAVVSGGGPLTDRDIDAAGSYVGGRIAYERVADLTLRPRTAALLLAK